MTLPSQSAGRTEGPWQLVSDPYEDGKPYFGFIAGGGNYPHGFHIAGILSEPDARLIARAPDLLAENSKLKGQLEEAVAALEKVLEVSAFHRSLISEHGFDQTPVEYDATILIAKLKEAGS